MEIEHVAGIGFASRRAAQQQRHLAIRHRLLGQVVIDDQRVLAAVAEVLAHGAARIGRHVLHGGGFGGRGGHDDGVIHGAVLLQFAHHLGDRGTLLADGDVDADHVAPLLVDDGVDGNGGLAGLAVTDDQLALAAPDRHHRVNRLEAGLHRLVNGLTLHDSGGLDLDLAELVGIDRTLAVNRLADGVNHAADQGIADRDLDDPAGPLDGVPFLDLGKFSQDGGADVVFFQVEHHSGYAAREFQQFAGHGAGQAVDTGDAVTDGDDCAGFGDFDFFAIFLDLLFDDLADLFRSDFHRTVSPLL